MCLDILPVMMSRQGYNYPLTSPHRQQLRLGNGSVIQNLQEACLNGDSQNRIPLNPHYLIQV